MNNIGAPFHYLSGGPFQGPLRHAGGRLFATQQPGRSVGQKLEMLNHEFRISGIVEHGKGARKFLPIATLQELIGAQDKASIFYVKLDNPANANQVVAEVKQVPGMERYAVRSLQDYLSLMTPGNLPGFSTFINVVIGVAVDHRLYRDFPVDVHGGDGENARDRNPEIAGRQQALHRRRDPARNPGAGHRRNRPRPADQLCRSRRTVARASRRSAS